MPKADPIPPIGSMFDHRRADSFISELPADESDHADRWLSLTAKHWLIDPRQEAGKLSPGVTDKSLG